LKYSSTFSTDEKMERRVGINRPSAYKKRRTRRRTRRRNISCVY
jgi:hypothetical protein